MKWATLDSLIENTLLANGMPIHYYMEYLVHASNCVRALYLDSLRVINVSELTLDDAFSAELPCDFVDEVMVGFRRGQLLQGIPKRNNITPTRKYNVQTGQPEPYNTTEEEITSLNSWPIFGYYNNFNDLGESTGAYFGLNTAAANPDGYKIFREQNRIQFLESLTTTEAVIMLYISDGQHIDNASMIDIRAWNTIQAYINWKRSPNRDNDRSYEFNVYKNMRRIMRAQVFGTTISDVRQALRSAYYMGPKN